MDNEKPFKCPKCTQCFATSDHLVVHQRMHVEENCNLLVKMPASSSEHVNDQTPTPTRFLKTGEVDGSVLFEDINPFDQAFASKRNASGASATAENASAISSTVEDNRRRELPKISTEISTNSVRRLPDGEPLSKRRANDEGEVSSSTVENNLREIDFKTLEKTHGSNVSHDQISSTSITAKQPAEVPVSLLCIEKSASSCEQIDSPSINVSSCSSSCSTPSSVSPTAAAESVLSSSNENPETQTSLQTLLNQIQKQTNTADASAKATPVSSSGNQSQEALREQLKSLIKSGQIKIKFTSDPSSPKVQATIVGNIAKKTVTPRPTPRPTLIPNTSSELLLKTDHGSPLPQTQQSNQVGIVQTLSSPKIQLPQKLVPSPMNTIPIKPKLSISKPIPIAPKGQLPEGNSSSDVSKSIYSSPLSVLSTTAPTVSLNSWSVPANSANSFTKQKLKHVIQQNATGRNETMTSVSNGHFSMVTSSNVQGMQGKYKDIMLDQGFDMDSDDSENYGNGRKQKIRINDDSTPEEKRQRFLERNRAAAARCRQKRKIWVNQLESKSDEILQTNNLLMNEINALRSEVAQLKALLLAHKDCPVTLEQKALLGQMTPGSYVAAVSDGQIIAIHQVPNGSGSQTDTSSTPAASAEEVASSALTDMAARATLELGNNSVSQASVSVPSAESGACTASSTVISA